MTWIAVKQFLKKAGQFIVDQWLFFLAAVVGVVGFFLGTRGSKAKEVLDLRKEAEKEERGARTEAKKRTEETMKILNNKMEELNEAEKEAVGDLLKDNAQEFEDKVLENKDKPLSHIVGELAAKHGLTKFE